MNGLISRASAFVPHNGDHPQLEHELRLYVDEQHFALAHLPACNGYAGSIRRHQRLSREQRGISRRQHLEVYTVTFGSFSCHSASLLQMTRTCTSANACPDTLHFASMRPLPSAFLCRMRSAILVVASPPAPRHPLLATRLRIVVDLHRDTLARRPPQGSSTHLPSPLAASRMLPAIDPMPWSLPPPTPPSHVSIHGRDFVASTQCLRPLPFVMRESRRCSELEWRIAGVDSTSAASMGGPHRCVRVRDGDGGHC
jgi:hypothetical protein